MIFVIVVPFLGVFVYLITQSHHMAERDMKEAQASQGAVRHLRQVGLGRRGGRRDREGERAPQLGCDHPGGVRRDQAEGARVVAARSAGVGRVSRPAPAAHSNALIANAVANPSVVRTPTHLPPFSNASGIIVSASIVMIAPPAKASTNAITEGEAASKRP